MVPGQVHDRAAGQDLADLAFEVGPLAGTPEVVDDQEPARVEIAPQPQDLGLGERHASHFDGVQERIPVQVGIIEAYGVLLGRSVEVGQQPTHADHELAIGLGIIDRPVPAPEAGVGRAREIELGVAGGAGGGGFVAVRPEQTAFEA